MEDFIINLLQNEYFYMFISFVFSICLASWFLGFGIKSVIRLIYNIFDSV